MSEKDAIAGLRPTSRMSRGFTNSSWKRTRPAQNIMRWVKKAYPCATLLRPLAGGLKVPVKSVSPEKAQSHFGWLAMFATHDLQASSAETRKKLGWNPTGPGLIADLEQMRYFETDVGVASVAHRA
jgi:hypothetical protein